MPAPKNKVLGHYGRPRVNQKSFRISFRILWKIFLFSLPLVILGGIAYFVFVHNYFEIKNINISGLTTVSENEFRKEISKIFTSRKWVVGKLSNYFLFPQDFAKAAIEGAFPKIGEVVIEKIYPEIVNISVVERSAIGVWCRTDNCFYFDKTGVIFEEAPKSFGGLMITVEDRRDREVKSGSKVLEEERIVLFEQAKNLFSKNFPFAPVAFIVTSKDEIEILTSENWRILLDKKAHLEYQFSNLKYVLDEQIKIRRRELDYVDLRLGNKIYYKFVAIDKK